MAAAKRKHLPGVAWARSRFTIAVPNQVFDSMLHENLDGSCGVKFITNDRQPLNSKRKRGTRRDLLWSRRFRFRYAGFV